MLAAQKWGMQPDREPKAGPGRSFLQNCGGQGVTQEFGVAQRRVGAGGGGEDGAGPTAPAARSMRSRTLGANSQRQAPFPSLVEG